MDVLHHDLETVEATNLRKLSFCAELAGQILEHDSVAMCKMAKVGGCSNEGAQNKIAGNTTLTSQRKMPTRT